MPILPDCIKAVEKFFDIYAVSIAYQNVLTLHGKIALCCVAALEHIFLLCPADIALPEAIFPWKFIKTSYQIILDLFDNLMLTVKNATNQREAKCKQMPSVSVTRREYSEAFDIAIDMLNKNALLSN